MNLGPFDTLPELSKDDALNILKTPLNRLKQQSDYYKAVFHLSKHPSQETEVALLDFLSKDSIENSILLAQRKAIEILGRMRCQNAIPYISSKLKNSDPYVVENAVWALQEIGCEDKGFHDLIGSLLEDPKQNHRLIIQGLVKMNAYSELPRIRNKLKEEGLSPGVRGAAIAAISSFGGRSNGQAILRNHLDLANQNERQSAVQDVIDAKAYELLEPVLRTPISPFFKLRAIDLLQNGMDKNIKGSSLIEMIDVVLIDNPKSIRLNVLDKSCDDPSLLVEQLFHPDFRNSYFALSKLIDFDLDTLWPTLCRYWSSFEKDYGALYFLLILIRHLKIEQIDHRKKCIQLIDYCLDNSWPAFMKFKPQAILSSMHVDSFYFQENIIKWLNESSTPFWACRYSTLIGFQRLLEERKFSKSLFQLICDQSDSNKYVRLKLKSICSLFNIT